MELNDLIKRKCEWLRIEGPRSNIAVSSRVRLARNIEGHLYFNRAGQEQRVETLNTVLLAAEKVDSLKGSLLLKIRNVSDLDKIFLVERHLMSRGHIEETEGKALIVCDREIVSLMLNEEDHLRLQVLQPGFNIKEAWNIADRIDTELGRYLKFDYSNKFGFLTSCPTNTGTGLRASVMLHLSALAMTNQIDSIFEGISKLGLTMRGFYGEGTEALGDFFQISNQVALGHSELEILSNLEGIINRIISREEQLRKELMEKKEEIIADRILRSYGTIKSARIITFAETIKLLSAVRLGVDLGIIKDVDLDTVNDILLSTQPAHLQKILGVNGEAFERDIRRADLIKKKLRITNKN
jgi:protein arginine kinase